MSTPTDSRFFAQWSRTYDAPLLQALAYRPVHDAVIGAIGPSSPDRIVDVGCGTGQLTARLRRCFPEAAIVGCDASGPMLGRAQEREAEESWVRADAQVLPFATATVDVVTCTESFHWYPDQAAAAAEFARVLRPGGRVLIASTSSLTTLGARIMNMAGAVIDQPVRIVPPRTMRRLLRAAGFVVRSQRPILRLAMPGSPLPVLTVADVPRS